MLYPRRVVPEELCASSSQIVVFHAGMTMLLKPKLPSHVACDAAGLVFLSSHVLSVLFLHHRLCRLIIGRVGRLETPKEYL